MPTPQRPLAILVHGMGRSPLSMALLALRLRRAGFATALFGYSAALERFEPCRQRLRAYIDARAVARPYLLIGHSLGTVLLRSVLPELAQPPAGFFLIGPPTRACLLARRCARLLPYRLFTGEMGQLLASEAFLRTVPVPQCPAIIYAGAAGPRWRWYPLGAEPNDGILTVSETQLPGVPHVLVPARHTLLMNSRILVRHLMDQARVMVSFAAPAGSSS